ncbi:MAG TPA: serine/threonine protein kinase [Cyanobacteria bacterium UBA8803]|nr:serine/threonine protein kinase [Cyanobacteria bacterium UBA9273]HBL59232.1 serine/threonine protein kinase [Cyanobacteria bacterium UBA8803]
MNSYPDFSNYGYQVVRELGHNRAGGRVTYLATEINTNYSVVIKQFQFARTGANWSDYEAYEREIQVLRGLDHPNIPRYLDSFQTSAGFCMVQEYKDAPSLASTIQWKPQQIKQIALAVLSILKYLQSQIPPVIHRDLKPENILVDNQMNVFLVDFGFARLGGGEVAVSSVIKGTLGFMPPEQMFNRQLSTASDLYSLGATLICLLTGTASTAVGTLVDDRGCISFKQQVSQISPAFSDWLQKMVAPNVKDRYTDANEALEALVPLELLRPNKTVKAVKAIPIPMVGLVSLSLVALALFRVQFSKFNHLKVTVTLDPASVSSKEQISINNERVYFGVNLSDLPPQHYESACQLFDANGTLVAMGQSTLNAASDGLKAWCWYDFNQAVDPPGNWTFKFFMDGQKVVQRKLLVQENRK